MAIREILKMGDPRLLRVAEPVTAFDTPELHALVADMFETMHAVDGAGLAAPQIGVNLQLVIFGFGRNQRYPDAPAAVCRVIRVCITKASINMENVSPATSTVSMRAWCSTRSITCSASSTPCASRISRASVSPK
jgi:peptide deformylase